MAKTTWDSQGHNRLAPPYFPLYLRRSLRRQFRFLIRFIRQKNIAAAVATRSSGTIWLNVAPLKGYQWDAHISDCAVDSDMTLPGGEKTHAYTEKTLE